MAKKKKKSKKQPAMSSRIKSPTKKQRRKMSQGTSSRDCLQPGANGQMIGTNK